MAIRLWPPLSALTTDSVESQLLLVLRLAADKSSSNDLLVVKGVKHGLDVMVYGDLDVFRIGSVGLLD